MPSTSKSQQRLMGMAYAAKKGELDSSKLGPSVKKLMESMSKKQLKDFAKTKHEGLPERKESEDKDPKVKKSRVTSSIKNAKSTAMNLKQYKTASYILNKYASSKFRYLMSLI